ncbi:MAG: CPBP family intramembrane metalloprotease [Gemmatimonadetes bacterium]|nr:CPBP family intramembrane metalloprotease [Gemmatimonadota bacterium]
MPRPGWPRSAWAEGTRSRSRWSGSEASRGPVTSVAHDWVGLLGRLLLFSLIALTVGWLAALIAPRALSWSALPWLLAAVVAARALRRIEGRPHTPLGFRLDRLAPRDAALGLALGVAVALAAVAAIALAGGVRWRGDAGTPLDWARAALGALWLLAIPAAAEEALLRGYPLQALAEGAGPLWALGITSVGFAALHLPNPGIGPVALANLAAAGLFLGALYLRTGSLWWATGAHLGWNWALAFLVDLPVSGLEMVDAPLLEPETSGPAWLSGAAFGPEGSVLAGVVLLAAAGWTWRTRWLGESLAAADLAEER